MKKWIALLLSCVMLLAMVAGCGGTPAESPSQSGGAGETAPQSAAPDGETKTYKVGFSNVWVGNTWGVQCVNELEAICATMSRSPSTISTMPITT